MARNGRLADFTSLETKGWIFLYISEAIWIIMINILTIITFSINRRFFGRWVIFVVNLSVADLAFGICFLTQGIYDLVFKVNGKLNESIYFKGISVLEIFLSFSWCTTGFGLVLIAVERVCATFAPFRYRAASLKVYAKAIGLVWCFSLGISIVHYAIPSQYFNFVTYFYAIGIFIGLLVIIISYLAIFIKVRFQNQEHNRADTPESCLQERKMAYTLMTVTFCSLVTWLPFGVVLLASEITTVPFLGDMLAFSTMVLASNSFINSIIYSFRMRDFRKALIRLLCKCSRNQIHPDATDSVGSAPHTGIVQALDTMKVRGSKS